MHEACGMSEVHLAQSTLSLKSTPSTKAIYQLVLSLMFLRKACGPNFVDHSSMVRRQKKLRYYLGIFPKWRTPHPLFWEPLIKKLSFILHFRALGTFLTFHQKVKILPISLH